MNLIASLQKEIMEQWRTSRLLVLLVVLGFFGMSSPLMAKFMPQLIGLIPGGEQFTSLIPQPEIQDAISQYIKNIGQFAVLLAIFLSMGTMVQEKERGTAVMMLSKPLGRGPFLLAKFLALAFSFFVSLAVAGVLGYWYTVFLFHAPQAGAWVGLNLLVWFYCLVYVAITLLASTIVRSQAAAAGISFGVLLVLAIFSSLPGLGQYLPGQLVNWGADLFTNPANQSWVALGVSGGVIVACLLAAWLVFRQQEL
jgi:ABC-2 type transport system permease protein